MATLQPLASTLTPDGIFFGDGEMARRMRELDWAKTALGPLEHWPQSLLTCLSTCLDCAFPIVIWWGPELTTLYNDEYIPILGAAKHPAALGKTGAAIWPEIWDVIGPMLSQVLELGEATRSRDMQMMLDRGFLQECYFSFSYSPIRAEQGKVGGVFCPVIETTQRVLGERRLRTLRDLAAKCRGAESERAAYQSAADILAENPFDVPFALIYGVNSDDSIATLEVTAGIEAGSQGAPRTVTLTPGETDPWSLNAVASSGNARVVDDPSRFFGALPSGAWKLPPRAVMVLPVLLPGQERASVILVAAVSPMQALDEDYRTFLGLIAVQLASSLADAQALAVERRRAEALDELDRAKTAFFSNVSHEFRTPLTLMLGPVEEAAANPEVPAPVRAQLEVARRNSLRLLKLVNSLLDFSRIEAGRVQASFEPTDLGALTSDLASAFRSAIEHAGLTFTVECGDLGEPIYLDHEMWEKIVLNLLSNAFKFTFDGSISLRLHREHNQAVLEIADTGVGIPAHELSRVFERFHRVEGSAGRTQEGSGIGLALVQELVKLHGGSIHATSKPGVGTTFSVRLPVGSAHLPADRIRTARSLGSTAIGAESFVQEALRWTVTVDAEASSSSAASGQSRSAAPGGRFMKAAGVRVLLADDNADMRAYIRNLLSPTYTVEAVADGVQALAAARRNPPDLILSDVMMPRIGGLELVTALRADPLLNDIPIILLSARAGEEARVEGFEAGADDYLVKPFSAREFLARVGAHLALRRARRDSMMALSEAEKRLRELFRQAPGFMCILRGPEHVFEFANDSYQLMVGNRDLIGKSVQAIFPEVEGQGFFELLDTVYRTGETITGSETLMELSRTPGGPLQSYFVDFVYQPIKDGSGSVTGIFVEGFDVTSRIAVQRDLRRSEALRQVALDAARMGTFTWYPEHDRSESDPRVLELFGTSESSGLTLDAVLAGLIDPQDRARYAGAVARALDPDGSGTLHEDIRITRPNDGSKHWLAISGQVFFEGAPPRAVRMIGTAMDITERKRVEEALKLADLQKDEFLAMLAHELRNPLAPISTASTLLSRTVDRDHRSHFAIETIKRQTRQLTRLVDDLLDVSRITRGRIVLQRQPLDLASVITQAVETVEPQLREKRHRISVTTSSYQSLHVSGDLTRVVQCMVNVLANAAKYTDPSGEIRVCTRSEGSEAVIEVSDTGVGISPELLPRIFDLFVQGDRTLDRAQGGLGIGLSVVKRLVEMHEGAISARSPGLGGGSTFEIRLPLIARPQPPQPESASITSPPRNVLVVDDNADAADTLAALLSVMGHASRVAFSGKDALEQLQTFEPDVVLLDIGLPGMNGYDLAKLLRGNQKLKNVRLVALTGYGQAEDRQRALAEGFEDHLVKPVDLQTLERILAASSGTRPA